MKHTPLVEGACVRREPAAPLRRPAGRWAMASIARAALLVAALGVVALVGACSGDDGGPTDSGEPRSGDPADNDKTAGDGFRLEAVSTRAEYVTGGDVLVALYGVDSDVATPSGDPAGEASSGEDPVGEDTDEDTAREGPDPATAIEVTVDGAAASVDWRPDGDRLLGLVEGLGGGDHEIVAQLGDRRTSLTVVDHPSTGPVFTGRQLPLVTCSTEAFGLGPPVGDDCSATAPLVTWSYVDTEGVRVELEDPTVVPDDVASMADGATPFVLREERGTINRAVYWITVPAIPPGAEDNAPSTEAEAAAGEETANEETANEDAANEDAADGVDDQARATWDPDAWNRRLVYEYGGGCGTSYSQGFTFLGGPDLDVLAAGYAHTTATFNTFQVMCDAALSAETTMMVKEHFAERYGPPELTIGTGGSGGAIQQYQILQNYPGLLDASAAVLPFPDAISIAGDVVDCGLLVRFFAGDAGAGWSDEQRNAVAGHLNAATCNFWQATFVPGVDPVQGCGPTPDEDTNPFYDPDENPDGLRCTLQDTNVNVLGVDPDTGFAERPWDNVGIVYGLDALVDGVIDVDQLLDLNEGMGSFDIDGRWVPERSRATEAAVAAAHAAGGVTFGAGDLRRVPVITVDIWTDEAGDIHTRERAFAVRERLRLPDGSDPPNHMVWTRGLPEGETLVGSLTGAIGLGLEVIQILDEWATAAAAVHDGQRRDDLTDDELWSVLEDTRPADAADNCITPDGERVAALDLYDQPGPCRDLFPVSASPRLAAGAPLVNDILACALVPAEDAALPVDLAEWSDEQRDRFRTLFGDGVCDWSAPGRGTAEWAGPWQHHGER
jgi:hypothetical protein